MYNVSVTFDTDVIDAAIHTAENAGRKFVSLLPRVLIGPSAERSILALSTEPEPPDTPVKWMNQKQRRAVMRKIRLAGNNFYIRTHTLSRGWSMVLTPVTGNAGIIGYENNTPYTDFVQGESQQTFLNKWPLARKIIRDTEASIQDEVVDVWIEATSL